MSPTLPGEPAERPRSAVSPTLPDMPAIDPRALSPKKTMTGLGAEPPPRAAVKKTMASLGAEPPPAAATKKTMTGLSAEPPPAMAPVPHSTMLGIGPLAAAPNLAPTPAPVSQHTAPRTGPASPDAPGKRTALGLGALPPPRQAAAAPPADAFQEPDLSSEQKTLLGIAHPGIAPLNPGQAKPVAGPSPPPVGTPPPFAAVPAANGELSEADLAVLPGHGRKGRRVPARVWALAIGAGMLLALAAALALLWNGAHSKLSASVSLGHDHREQLALSCRDCPDGTTVSLDGQSAAFRGGSATLVGIHKLDVGNNRLSISLQRPGASTSTVELVVPVDYQVRGDFSTLADGTPKLRVRVHAISHSSVVVNGHALKLGADGRAHYDLNVSRDLTGGAARVLPLARTVAYIITPPNSAPEHGTVELRLGIVPLEVNAPGPRIVIDSDHFMLAGETAANANLQIAGHPIKVDRSGHFAQLMNVSSVGETMVTVRASAPQRAPRLFPVFVKRVVNLREEAAAFVKKATTSYADIASNIDSKAGSTVAFQGKVVDARVTDHVSAILIDVERGCAAHPCLARLVFGESTKFKSGDSVSAFGHVTRAVQGPQSGTRIPEVHVEFILKGQVP